MKPGGLSFRKAAKLFKSARIAQTTGDWDYGSWKLFSQFPDAQSMMLGFSTKVARPIILLAAPLPNCFGLQRIIL